MVNLLRLPLAKTNFEKIISKQLVYVDKTDLVAKIAAASYPHFFSRPRRFGKSLLISTFESLFKNGVKYFKGLKLEKLWNDKPGYKVLKLNFSDITPNDTSDLDKILHTKLRNFCKANNIDVDIDDNEKTFFLFDNIIEKCSDEIVLLVDEYDTILAHSLDNKEQFNSYQKYFQSFYGILKNHVDDFRFIFITGVSRFSHTSIFSKINNLKDITLLQEYATLLGYTEEELHFYFDEYIEYAGQQLSKSKEEVYQELKLHYDGYLMSEKSDEKVYNPWSILNFLSEPANGFSDYWYESGGSYPMIIVNYLKNNYFDDITQIDKIPFERKDLTESYEFFTIPPTVLLYQAGYLTIYKEKNKYDFTTYFVPPNLEVRSALSRLYLNKVRIRTPSKFAMEQIYSLPGAFAAEDIETIVKIFNIILNGFGYDIRELLQKEGVYRDILLLALCMSGIDAKKETQTIIGRSDLIAEDIKRRYVFEFKLADKDNEALKLKEAVTQIKNGNYGEILPLKKLLKFAIVVNKNIMQITNYKQIS